MLTMWCSVCFVVISSHNHTVTQPHSIRTHQTRKKPAQSHARSAITRNNRPLSPHCSGALGGRRPKPEHNTNGTHTCTLGRRANTFDFGHTASAATAAAYTSHLRSHTYPSPLFRHTGPGLQPHNRHTPTPTVSTHWCSGAHH